MEVGAGTPFVQLPHDQWGQFVTESFLKGVWREFLAIGLTLEATEGRFWVPPLQSDNDA